MNNNEMMEKLTREIESTRARSAWARGVKDYALLLLDSVRDACEFNGVSFDSFTPAQLKQTALNGARDWGQYSWGGCALIYDSDIAKALCNPSELKRTNNGEKRPNAREQWLDVQARALYQAFALLRSAFRACNLLK